MLEKEMVVELILKIQVLDNIMIVMIFGIDQRDNELKKSKREFILGFGNYKFYDKTIRLMLLNIVMILKKEDSLIKVNFVDLGNAIHLIQ